MPKNANKLAQVVIHNLDEQHRKDRKQFTAFYNPKEISISQNVPWGSAGNKSAKFEFTHFEPKSFSCELFCDLYELRGDARTEFAEPLFYLAEPHGKKEYKLKVPRPCVCLFVWGRGIRFLGVIESVSIKYSMFLPNGVPCRATASLKLKEAKYLRNTRVERDARGRITGYGPVERGDRSGGTKRTI